MPRALVPAAALLLGACDFSAPTGEPNGPLRTDSAQSDNTTENEIAETADAGTLPPQGQAPRFVGNWAADEKSCESAAWRFTDSTLHTPTGGSCSFNRITETPQGYEIQATCTASGAPKSETLSIRFAESAKAMLLDSETLKATGLVFCGRDA